MWKMRARRHSRKYQSENPPFLPDASVHPLLPPYPSDALEGPSRVLRPSLQGAAATTPTAFSAPHEPPAAAFCSSCTSCNYRLPSARHERNTLSPWVGFIPVSSPCPSPRRSQGTRAEPPEAPSSSAGAGCRACVCKGARARCSNPGSRVVGCWQPRDSRLGTRPELRSANASSRATAPSWGNHPAPGEPQAGKAAGIPTHGQLQESRVLSASLTPLVLNAI